MSNVKKLEPKQEELSAEQLAKLQGIYEDQIIQKKYELDAISFTLKCVKQDIEKVKKESIDAE